MSAADGSHVRVAVVLAATVCSACTTLTVDVPEGAGGNRTYVGVVNVRATADSSNVARLPRVRRFSFSTLGLRVDSGVSVGYLHDEVVSVPFDCRVVLFVRSPEEWSHAAMLLRQLGREDSCLVQSN